MSNIDEALLASLECKRAVELLLGRSNLSNAERSQIRRIHQPWRQKQYSSDEFVRHGIEPDGNPGLYRARRNVAANALPPDQNSNDWLKIT